MPRRAQAQSRTVAARGPAWHSRCVPDQPPRPPAVRFAGVVKRFGDVVALDAITLDIASDSFVALVGINRLVQPDAGRIEIDGAVPDDIVQLRRRIGYAFQNVGLFPHLTVAANIEVPLRLLDWPATRRAARESGCRMA